MIFQAGNRPRWLSAATAFYWRHCRYTASATIAADLEDRELGCRRWRRAQNDRMNRSDHQVEDTGPSPSWWIEEDSEVSPFRLESQDVIGNQQVYSEKKSLSPINALAFQTNHIRTVSAGSDWFPSSWDQERFQSSPKTQIQIAVSNPDILLS